MFRVCGNDTAGCSDAPYLRHTAFIPATRKGGREAPRCAVAFGAVRPPRQGTWLGGALGLSYGHGLGPAGRSNALHLRPQLRPRCQCCRKDSRGRSGELQSGRWDSNPLPGLHRAVPQPVRLPPINAPESRPSSGRSRLIGFPHGFMRASLDQSKRARFELADRDGAPVARSSSACLRGLRATCRECLRPLGHLFD